MMTAGQRLTAGQEVQFGPGVILAYQGDGNLVLYVTGRPVWSSGTHGSSSGHVDLQHDGNLVIYDAAGVPIWATDTQAFNPRLTYANGKFRLFGESVVWSPTINLPDVQTPPPPPTGPVRRLDGPVRPVGRGFGDVSGARIVHGCSDFPGVVKFKENPDKVKREMDAVAPYVQYIRVLPRLNGWKWTTSGLTVDPSRDSWFDAAYRGYCQAAHDRGLRLNVSSGDMNNWTLAQMEDGFARFAQIPASIHPDLVWLHAVTNEMHGTWLGGETDEHIQMSEHLLRIVARHAPNAMRAISDPDSRDKAGMQRLSGGSANCALIHQVRWSNADALRRAFNDVYENYPGEPIVQDEPTGPNGSPPWNEFTRLVYQPTEDHDELFALYTMHILTGQASTYFNDPALVSREPLDSTWGLKEIPALWRQMEIPEDIGLGEPLHGGRPNAMMRVVGSNAARADGTTRGAYNLGVISGGSNWRVRSGRDGVASGWRASGRIWERRVSQGDVLEEPGPKPTVVRIVS